MRLRSFLVVFIAALVTPVLWTDARAQIKKELPTPEPVTTQSGVTEGGRKVILKSNGTWQYDSDRSAATATTQTATAATGKADSVISFEAGLVFKSGDVKPVARANFYLLDSSLASILRNAGIKAPSTRWGN